MTTTNSHKKGIRQAVMLAGGMGVRLRPYTLDTPKPMVNVNGRPFVDYLIEFLKSNGIKELVLLLGYLPEKVVEHVGDGSKFGLRVKYSIGGVDDYTGTRVRNAQAFLDDTFLLLYCDNYLPMSIPALADFHARKNVSATVTVYTNTDGRTKNNMFVNADGRVTIYDRSRAAPDLNGVDMGFFIMKKDVVDAMPAHNFWFEEETVPRLIAEKSLAGFQVDHPYYSLSTPEKMAVLEKFLAPKKIVFFEREAALRDNQSAAAFSASAIEALKLFQQKEYGIYLVGNHDRRTPELMEGGGLLAAYKRTEDDLASHGVRIQGMYDCHHGTGAACECRMPKPGLLLEAARDHCLDLTKTLFLAGTETGARAGEAVGIPTILIKAGENPIDAILPYLERA